MSAQPTPRVPSPAEMAGFPDLFVVTNTEVPAPDELGLLINDQSANELHALPTDVLISPDISPDKLRGYNIDPLVDRTIAGLGKVCLKDVRMTGGKKQDQPTRIHRLYTVERFGFNHAMEVTDPVNGIARYTILSIPGWTEPIEGALRKGFQADMSYKFPDARICSIGANGVGETGDRYDSSDRNRHGLLAMAAQRLALARAVSGEQPVIGVGTSMGSVILHRLVRMNFLDTPEDGQLNLVGQIWASPALVDPEHVAKDMVQNFLPKMGVHILKELLFKTSPREALEVIYTAARYGSSKADCRAIIHQAVELLQGTEEESVEEVVSLLPTLVVAGSKDSLAQLEMMHRLEKKYGNLFHLEVIDGRGHELCMKPGKACAKISKAGRFLVEHALKSEPLTA